MSSTKCPLSICSRSITGRTVASHLRWSLDRKVALVSPEAIIIADDGNLNGLQLEECGRDGSRHYRQTATQHQRILEVLEAMGPDGDCSDGSSGSAAGTKDNTDDDSGRQHEACK